MKYIICIALVIIVSASELELENYTFQDYINDYQKVYTNEEKLLRQFIFQKNLREIIEHNKQDHSYKQGVNQFTDRTPEELNQLKGYHKGLGQSFRLKSNGGQVYKLKGVTVPESFDWRDHKPSVLTPPKNQGSCGSCWAFSTAESVESHWAIHNGELLDLSEQQIASCTDNPQHCGGTGGCEGGICQLAYESIIKRGGLTTESKYPYKGKDGACIFDATKTPAAAVLTGYTDIPTNSYDELIEALYTEGPISVSVDASNWWRYSKGVYDGCNTSSPDVDHAVLLVGYGVDSKYGPYWTIRNSWGPSWGESGHIRIKRTPANQLCGWDTSPADGTGCDGGPDKVYVCGMCGILYDNTFPNVASKVEIVE